MNRRNVLLGLGTAAAGSGIVFGSGAFTQVQAERSVTIGISEDSNALLELDAGDNVRSVYNNGESGELVIDTDRLTSDDDNNGFNVGSTVQIGETRNDFGDQVVNQNDDVAFKLTNNFDNVAGDENGSLDIGINLDDLSGPDSSLKFIGSVYNGDTGSTPDRTKAISDGGRQVFSDIESSDAIYFAIRVETTSTTNPEDFEGNIVFEAGPDLSQEFPTESSEIASDTIINTTQDIEYDTSADATLKTALDEANTGDLLQLGDGSYVLNEKITTDGLTIQGPNVGIAGDKDRNTEATIESDTGTVIVVSDAENVDISGVEISGNIEDLESSPDSGNQGVSVRSGSSVTVSNSKFADCYGAIQTLSDRSQVTVEGIDVSNSVFGVGLQSDTEDEVRNSTFSVTSQGIGINGSNTNVVDNNITVDDTLGDTAFTTVRGIDFLYNGGEDVVIEQNTISSTDTAVLSQDSAIDITIVNNTIEGDDTHVDDDDNSNLDIDAVLNNNTFNPSGKISDSSINPE